jgi:beta-N-acetylhexosaminidase
VDTNPENPIIGDRSFARNPERVAECGAAYSRGLASAGLQSCLKHFPGHGDTLLDSHLALPTVAHDTDRLRSVELVPFARLAREADSIMTAHVLYPALDALPATLSRRISTELLRGELGFAGVLFSDDLEMRAMAGYGTMAEVAVGAIEAGCDILLICSDEARQAEVHEALTRRIERDAAFRERCLEAASRSATLRRARPPQPGTEAELDLLLDSDLRPLEAELAALVAAPQV